ncbi:MAG TPA: DedA family protein [Candidatus Saccharimonadales bacterium]|nr:DedA family protein [Candidatus Saccharimonadales bacterium]
MSQDFIHLLPYWGYPLMFVLMFFEGPFATMIAAFLASQGFFNIGIVFVLSVSADVLGDIGLYHIGYYGGPKIMEKAQKFLKISNATIEKLKNKFHQNSSRVIFYVKSTTGLCAITFILAGTLRMKFLKFIKYSFLGGLVWSSFIVILGYFFGYAAAQISQYIKYAGVAIFAAAIIAVVVISLIKKRESAEILGNGNGN